MKTLEKSEMKDIKGGCPPDPRCSDYIDYCDCTRTFGVVAPDCNYQI
jgi:hypothetical protein